MAKIPTLASLIAPRVAARIGGGLARAVRPVDVDTSVSDALSSAARKLQGPLEAQTALYVQKHKNKARAFVRTHPQFAVDMAAAEGDPNKQRKILQAATARGWIDRSMEPYAKTAFQESEAVRELNRLRTAFSEAIVRDKATAWHTDDSGEFVPGENFEALSAKLQAKFSGSPVLQNEIGRSVWAAGVAQLEQVFLEQGTREANSSFLARQEENFTVQLSRPLHVLVEAGTQASPEKTALALQEIVDILDLQGRMGNIPQWRSRAALIIRNWARVSGAADPDGTARGLEILRSATINGQAIGDASKDPILASAITAAIEDLPDPTEDLASRNENVLRVLGQQIHRDIADMFLAMPSMSRVEAGGLIQSKFSEWLDENAGAVADGHEGEAFVLWNQTVAAIASAPSADNALARERVYSLMAAAQSQDELDATMGPHGELGQLVPRMTARDITVFYGEALGSFRDNLNRAASSPGWRALSTRRDKSVVALIAASQNAVGSDVDLLTEMATELSGVNHMDYRVEDGKFLDETSMNKAATAMSISVQKAIKTYIDNKSLAEAKMLVQLRRGDSPDEVSREARSLGFSPADIEALRARSQRASTIEREFASSFTMSALNEYNNTLVKQLALTGPEDSIKLASALAVARIPTLQEAYQMLRDGESVLAAENHFIEKMREVVTGNLPARFVLNEDEGAVSRDIGSDTTFGGVRPRRPGEFGSLPKVYRDSFARGDIAALDLRINAALRVENIGDREALVRLLAGGYTRLRSGRRDPPKFLGIIGGRVQLIVEKSEEVLNLGGADPGEFIAATGLLLAEDVLAGAIILPDGKRTRKKQADDIQRFARNRVQDRVMIHSGTYSVGAVKIPLDISKIDPVTTPLGFTHRPDVEAWANTNQAFLLSWARKSGWGVLDDDSEKGSQEVFLLQWFESQTSYIPVVREWHPEVK